jgi:hypothetical protein
MYKRYQEGYLMFMYSIDKDVPLPADKCHSGSGRGTIYPFAKMQPGDSVFIEGARTDGKEYSAARKMARKRRLKGVECRFTARNENGGMRVWRVK